MIKYLSKGIADKLYENKIVLKDDLNIYRYGAEILISSAIGILLVIVMGIILDRIGASIAFLIVFIPVRTYTGGYHASSYSRCMVCTSSVFVLMIILCETVFACAGMFAVCISSAYSLYVIVRFSPIENEKKNSTSSVIYGVWANPTLTCINTIKRSLTGNKAYYELYGVE